MNDFKKDYNHYKDCSYHVPLNKHLLILTIVEQFQNKLKR